MKNLRYLYILIFFLSFSSFLTHANVSTYKFTYSSYAARNFSGWENMLNKSTEMIFEKGNNYEAQISLLIDYYGYIGHLLDIGNKELAKKWNKKALILIGRLKKTHGMDAQFLALNSMFIAYDIAITPLKAPLQASEMFKTSKKALHTNPSHYLAQLAEGNILFYFPSALGGDKRKGLAYYLQVYNYFKKSPELASQSWVYLNILSTISVAYESLGEKKLAIAWAKKALSIEPNFVYVKTILLPRLLN